MRHRRLIKALALCAALTAGAAVAGPAAAQLVLPTPEAAPARKPAAPKPRPSRAPKPTPPEAAEPAAEASPQAPAEAQAPPPAAAPAKRVARPPARQAPKPAPPASPDETPAPDAASDSAAAPVPAKPPAKAEKPRPAAKAPARAPDPAEPAATPAEAGAADTAAPAPAPDRSRSKASSREPRGKDLLPKDPPGRNAAVPSAPLPPLPAPLPVLQPAQLADPALIADGRLLGQRTVEALPTPTGDSPTMVVTRSMGRTPRALYPAASLSPPGVAVYDTELQSPDSSAAAPIALNSFEAIKAGVPAGPFRAGLVEESENDVDRPRIETGTVMWRIEYPPGSDPDAPPSALVAEVIIDSSRLKTVVSLKPGRDPATGPLAIEITMSGEPGSVTQIGVPELRNPGIERGIPLYGTVSAETGAPFSVALAGNDRDGEQNIRLLTQRPWIDIPFRTKEGKRYTLAFEKGTAVREMMRSTFRSWRLPWLP